MQPMLHNHSQNIKTGVNLRLGHVRLIIVYSGPAQPTQINLNIPTCTLEIFSTLKERDTIAHKTLFTSLIASDLNKV